VTRRYKAKGSLMDAPLESLYRKNFGCSSTVSVLEAIDGRASTSTEGDTYFVPYHAEDGFVLCWGCHGYLVGPPGRRLCHCQEPGPVSPAEAEKLRTLKALRDARAAGYRRRWFKALLPHMRGADKDEARAVWDGLWPAARLRAARRLAERGLR
jgi:hypothetical protein